MVDLSSIRIEDYEYPLTEDLIAQFPAEKRDGSRLLVVSGQNIREDVFTRLDHYLPENSLLVFNNTRVIRARLLFRNSSGSLIEIFCLEPVSPVTEIASAFQHRSGVEWNVMVGNLKRWKSGTLTIMGHADGKPYTFWATVVQLNGDGTVRIRFDWAPAGVEFGTMLELTGKTPLPPYIKREADIRDIDRYQTIYARHEGSVAAPTAGLHFTPEVMASLRTKAIDLLYVTLHVGAGTFRQVTTETILGHEMHQEHIHVDINAIRTLIRSENRPVIAVGTTATRTLESLYWIGCQLIEKPGVIPRTLQQWYPYQSTFSAPVGTIPALEALVSHLESAGLTAYEGETRLMIVPGYRFRLVKGMVTNFHVPRSTLLLLVAAMVGDQWKEAYQYAVDHRFRFLSYGDACLFSVIPEID